MLRRVSACRSKLFNLAVIIVSGGPKTSSVVLRRLSRYVYKLPNKSLAIALTFPVVVAAHNQKHIIVADEFYNTLKYRESYNVLLQFKDSNDDEVLWRLGRALLNIAQEDGVSDEEKKALIQEGYEIMQQALNINNASHSVHKYAAMLLDAKTNLEGIKAKINSLPQFQEHIRKSIELNPQDAMSYHMLGQFHYILSELPWIQKKLVATLFGTIPDTSFEEAVSCFSKAEEISPNFYCKNLLLLAKTYLKLGKADSALHWLHRAANCDAITIEDKNVKQEAQDLLKKHSK